ncbi:MAG: hypothetical protein ACXVBX_05560 [Flavisolibacter sp.]
MAEGWPDLGRRVVEANYYHHYVILIASYYHPITISLLFLHQQYVTGMGRPIRDLIVRFA